MWRTGALILVAMTLLSCSGDSPALEAGGTTSATASATPGPTQTPDAASPLPVRTPRIETAIGESRPLALEESEVQRQRHPVTASTDVEEWAWQKLYNVDRDELWITVGPEGNPYELSLNPDSDLGVGGAWTGGRVRTGETVVVDLWTGSVQQLFAFPTEVRAWQGPNTLLIKISVTQTSPPQSVDWTAGVYEIDLIVKTATLVSTTRPYREEVRLPDGSVLGTGILE